MQLGLTFKGKRLTPAYVKTLNTLEACVSERQAAVALSLMEPLCPELQHPTLRMRIAPLSESRGAARSQDPGASGASMMLMLDRLRVWRRTGELTVDSVDTVRNISGHEKRTPAAVHVLFRKVDATGYALHEA